MVVRCQSSAYLYDAGADGPSWLRYGRDCELPEPCAGLQVEVVHDQADDPLVRTARSQDIVILADHHTADEASEVVVAHAIVAGLGTQREVALEVRDVACPSLEQISLPLGCGMAFEVAAADRHSP